MTDMSFCLTRQQLIEKDDGRDYLKNFTGLKLKLVNFIGTKNLFKLRSNNLLNFNHCSNDWFIRKYTTNLHINDYYQEKKIIDFVQSYKMLE